MAGFEQMACEVPAGKAGRAGHEDLHVGGTVATCVPTVAAITRSQTCLVRTT
jgi:hypothetical protein